LIVGDACNRPFQDSKFDASISIGTLHLITEWKSALREIVRVTMDSLAGALGIPEIFAFSKTVHADVFRTPVEDDMWQSIVRCPLPST